MRKASVISLLLAGTLLSLAGCQKGDGVRYGEAVRFKAASAIPATRTAYNGDPLYNGFERINWVEGESILIWSDNAADRNDVDNNVASPAKHAVYQIQDVTESGVQSKATLSNAPGENGLVYVKGVDSYKFWGISPVTSGTPVAGQASFEIKAAQQMAGTTVPAAVENVTTLPVDMSNAWLVAAVEGAKEGSTVEIPFYPAFTAFEFTFEGDKEYEGNINVTKVELVSDTKLAGNVVATLAPNGASTYACTPTADPVFTLPGETYVSQTQKVVFTMFAMPQKIVGLKLRIHAKIDGEETTFTGTMKKDGNPIELDACKKYRIKGVAVPGNLWKIYYAPDILDVDKWVEAGEATTTTLIVE